MSTRSSAVRAIASSTFLAMGVVLAALGVVLMEARHSLLTPDGLAQRAGAILADPRVAAYAADRATTAVLEHQPDLTGFRPIIASVASATVSSPAFQRAAQAGVRTAASALLSEGGSRVTMSIPDLGILLRGAVAQANPALAERIPPRVRGVVVDLGQGPVPRAAARLLQLSRRLARYAMLLLALGVSCAAAGVAFARDRRQALLELSVNVVLAGIVLLVLRASGGWFLQSRAPDTLAREAIAGAWDALTARIRGWALTLALAGVVGAASAHSVLDRLSVSGTLARAWRLLEDPPGGAWGKLASGLFLVAIGVAIVSQPRLAAEWVMWGAGGACVFAGVRETLALLGRSSRPPPPGRMRGRRAAGASAASRSWGPRQPSLPPRRSCCFAPFRPRRCGQRVPATARRPFAAAGWSR